MIRSLFLVLIVPGAFLAMSWDHQAAREVALAGLAPQPAELIFSHRLHVVDEELECADCHDGAETSTGGIDNLLPAQEVCADCHEVDEPESCATCHLDADNPRIVDRIETYSLAFSHERHLAADLTCASCHEAVVQKETAEPVLLPTMVGCMDCHEDRRVDNECATCHLPSERLTPISHTPNFIHAHSDLARHNAVVLDAEKTCQTCHDDDFCQDCHEGDNLDRFTHPLNFSFTHALEAQANEQACISCHTDRQFCIECHQDNLVLPHNHAPGWVNAIPNDGGRHRLEALNDLETCMACHEDNADRICQPCHGGPN